MVLGSQTVQKEKEDFIVACLLPPKDVKLSIFMSQSCSDSKQMYWQKHAAHAKLWFCSLNLICFWRFPCLCYHQIFIVKFMEHIPTKMYPLDKTHIPSSPLYSARFLQSPHTDYYAFSNIILLHATSLYEYSHDIKA